MTMYEIPNDLEGNPRTDIVIRVTDQAAIPTDEGNSDYQRYLRWLENPDAEENGTIS